MIKGSTFRILAAAAILFTCSPASCAEELMPIKLLPPQTEGGKPLMQALKDRKSMRAFSSRELPDQILSDLLWAAFGINRPDSGLRTAPTTRNMQEIDIYVVNARGVYLYDAKANALNPVLSGDIRALTGAQAFVKNAPINLVYVSDLSRMAGVPPKDVDFYTATDTGFISENVYLYCSSAGLSTVVRGWLDKAQLAKAMRLRPDQRVVLAQTVGYPGE